MKTEENTITYNKNNPFPASLTERRKLTREGSEKETFHFSIDITGSGMTYQTGDWLGIYPTNDPANVQELLQALHLTGEEEITLPKLEHKLSLKTALLHHLSLIEPTKKFLEWISSYVTDPNEKALLHDLLSTESSEKLNQYLADRDFIDLANEFKSAASHISPQEYILHLKRLLPRLYSIASSSSLYPNEIHLTIVAVRIEAHERKRNGVTSTYLTDRVALYHEKIPVFVAHSQLRLPENFETDIIMIGPGTGVAPFRGFIQEYAHHSAKGRTWLFFGEQRRSFNYLYEEELTAFLNKKLLTRLDLAFSRDQEHKIYVQDKMLENASTLWDWINQGAYIYVCGDAKRMAKDVESTLHEIIQKEGNMTSDEAIEYLKLMKKQKRYQKDVY
ncbi:MAG: sulfite reductase subunit alpha [Verrucomicrobia bacterium]|nr:MAG: sulfite reductase subunit alpha [Verrucomicrobiota bacterium]